MARRRLIQAYRAIEKTPASARQPRSAPRQGSLSRARELPARSRPHGDGTSHQPQPRADVVGRRRRGARKGHRLYRPADGAAGASAQPLGRRQPEEFDGPARYFHAADRRSQRSIRRRAARLSRTALHRDFAAQLQRARARRLEAQPDQVPQPQRQAAGARRLRADRPADQGAARRHPARRRRARLARRPDHARRAAAARPARSSATARRRTATSSTSTAPAPIRRTNSGSRSARVPTSG